MANSLVTFSILAGYGFNKLRERIKHLECICVYCCLAIYIYFELTFAQSLGKKIVGKVTVKNYFKENLLSILCFKRALILKFILLRMVINFDTNGFLVSTHAMR